MRQKMMGSRAQCPISLPGLPGIPPDAPPGAWIGYKKWNMIVILADAEQTKALLDLLSQRNSNLPQ